jgi:hypothetical protein
MNHDDHKECIATVKEMQKEWAEEKENRRKDSMKIVWGLIASLGIFVGYGVWIGSTNSEIVHTKEDVSRLSASVTALSISDTSTQATLAGIKQQLTGIEVTLQEIKIKLR